MPKHLMVDLETLDTRPTSVVLSIGAIAFDPQSKWLDTTGGFEQNLRLEEQFEAGRTISESTLLWWLDQSEDARKSITGNPRKTVEDSLEGLREYASRMNCEYVWSNGAAFDVVILEHLMDYTKIPWKFYKVLDMRTMMWLKNVPKQGATAHKALDDAIDQAHRVVEAYASIR